MKHLMLVDSYAQIFRAFYAVRALTNSRGEPSNAVFAMTKFLLKLQDDYPDWDGAFVFDEGRPPHRMKLAPLYKANRPPMPDALKQQMDAIRGLIAGFGWPVIQYPDWEADDLIACIVRQFSDPEILIVSADKDLAQIVNERVRMLVPDSAGGGFSLRGIPQVREKFGVPPEMILDYLALIGDSADNIPGVEGVGPKTAEQLLLQFGSIAEILAHPDRIGREKLRMKLAESGELLRKNVELIRLVDHGPQEACWTEQTFHRRTADYRAILETAERFELKSLLKDLTDRMEKQRNAPGAASEETTPAGTDGNSMEQPDLFA